MNDLVGAEEDFEAAGVDIADHADDPHVADPFGHYHVSVAHRQVKGQDSGHDRGEDPHVDHRAAAAPLAGAGDCGEVVLVVAAAAERRVGALLAEELVGLAIAGVGSEVFKAPAFRSHN